MSIGTTTHHVDAPRLSCEYVYLFIALAAGGVTAAVWTLDSATPASVPVGIYCVLCVAITLSGCGYLIRSGNARVRRQLEQLEQAEADLEQIRAEARKEGYAQGFVDCATGRANADHPATLRTIH